ncbi:MAG: reverse transcriptase domain-containing protein [Verrucomicrobiota bacterium]
MVKELLAEMLEDKVIQRSNSPWASPVVLVRKKDGSQRFCVDYRKLNAVTRKDSYPLPRIDQTLESVAGSTWFTTLDLKSSYWQVAMDPRDVDKTAFVTPQGLFEFRAMAFGLVNAPATFQRLMETVLGSLGLQTCVVYLDDVTVHGRTFEDALNHLEQVLQRLRAAELTLKPSKCHLFQKEAAFLGHIVSGQGVRCDPRLTSDVVQWETPTHRRDVQAFLGLANYYRRFIPAFADIAAPIQLLTHQDEPFRWGPEQQIAFEQLKTALTSPPILSYPLEDAGMMVLDTDASDLAVGAVLSQVQNGEERVLGYYSKTLSRTQRNYCTTQRELLAVVEATDHFRVYLLGQKFKLRTDHASLRWLINFKDPTGKLARWISRLADFDYVIEHRPGRLHTNADALSRRPTRRCPRLDCLHCRPEGAQVDMVAAARDEPRSIDDYDDDDVAELQRADPHIGQVIRWLTEAPDKPPPMRGLPREQQQYLAQWDRLQIHDDRLYLLRHTPGKNKGPVWQLVAPPVLRELVFHELHTRRTGGHLGVTRTSHSTRQRFYWPGIKRDITRWVKACIICARNKTRRPPPARLRQQPTLAPFERMAVDITFPGEMSADGNTCIVVFMDYYTKWAEAFPLPDHRAETVAGKLVEEIVCRFGVPRELHSDQGREFEGRLIHELAELLQMSKTRTNPYRPQSDGLVERFNHTLKQMLNALCEEDPAHWDRQIPYALLAYRSTPQASTGESPHLLLTGREVVMPVDLLFGPPPGEQLTCTVEFVETIRRRMTSAYERARQQLGQAAHRQKARYDLRARDRDFAPGVAVWRYYPPAAAQHFRYPWQGPYRIRRRLNEVTYELEGDSGRAIRAHVSHLWPCHHQDDEADVVPAADVAADGPGEVEDPVDEQELPQLRRSQRPRRPPQRYHDEEFR